jgi:hypothetical protein
MPPSYPYEGWPKLVKNPAEVPDIFQDAVRTCFPSLPYTVYLPARSTLLRPKAAHLVCLSGSELVVFTPERPEVSIEIIDLSTLTHIEIGRILLHSWITVFTRRTACTFTFNMVRDDLMAPIVRAARSGRRVDLPKDEGFEAELRKLDLIDGLGIKFLNYGKKALLPGDRIVSSLFEPLRVLLAIRLFGGQGIRKYATPHLWMLTARELIIVRDVKETAFSERIRYGVITTCIFRAGIDSVTVRQLGEITQITLSLHGGRAMSGWFSSDNPGLKDFTTAVGARSLEGREIFLTPAERRSEVRAARGHDGLLPKADSE